MCLAGFNQNKLRQSTYHVACIHLLLLKTNMFRLVPAKQLVRPNKQADLAKLSYTYTVTKVVIVTTLTSTGVGDGAVVGLGDG